MDVRVVPLEDWRKEGYAIFGSNRMSWKFVCPICGSVACGADFAAMGKSPNCATQECIGRYTRGRSAFFDKEGKPCDYAAYGFIDVCVTQVDIGDGKKVSVFEFAKE